MNDFVPIVIVAGWKATVCVRERLTLPVSLHPPTLAHTFAELVILILCIQAQAAAPMVYWKDIPSGLVVNGVYRARRISGLIYEISFAPVRQMREQINDFTLKSRTWSFTSKQCFRKRENFNFI